MYFEYEPKALEKWIVRIQIQHATLQCIYYKISGFDSDYIRYSVWD